MNQPGSISDQIGKQTESLGVNVDEICLQLQQMIDFGQKCLDSSLPNTRFRDLSTSSLTPCDSKKERSPVLRNNEPHSSLTSISTTPVITSLIEQVKQLTEVNNQLTNENIQLNQRLAEYKNQLDRTLQENASLRQIQSSVNKDIEDDNELLRAQLEIFREDFKSERRDREAAQNKLANCEQRVAELQQQVAAYRRQGAQRHAASETDSQRFLNPRGAFNIEQTAPSRSIIGQGGQQQLVAPSVNNSSSLISRGLYQTDGLSSVEVDEVDSPMPGRAGSSAARTRKYMEDYPQFDEVDSPMQSKAIGYSMARSNTFVEDDPLLCPICSKRFSTSNHAQLLEHMEGCTN